MQIGIWDSIALEVIDSPFRGPGGEFRSLRCWTSADVAKSTGILHVRGWAENSERVHVALKDGDRVIRERTVEAGLFNGHGVDWSDLAVQLWWPNLSGKQPLYTLECTLRDAQGGEQDRVTRRVGFRKIEWRACQAAPRGADPWVCVVNGRPVFLQGVNFPPPLPNFADTPEARYRRALETYRDLGVNALRVNGVGFLEKEQFYDLCDEFGLMVWQDVPLSSSGVENVAPDDPRSVSEVSAILRSFIERRQHHASL